MNTFNSVEEILNFAITKEEEAFQFYTELASTMKHTYVKDIFEKFANLRM